MLAMLMLSSTFLINGYSVTVEKAVTQEQQMQGLADRTEMAENHGMLFVFPGDSTLQFWMEGMNFPLDMIWMDKTCRIVHISANQQPCQSEDNCPYIGSQFPSQYVLEVNAGFSALHHIQVGDRLPVCGSR